MDSERFDKFTERARKVFCLAQEEAQRFQHTYLGTEHLLLGLLREGEGAAVKVLSNLGVELNLLRSTLESVIGRGDGIVLGEFGLTPGAKKVIEFAVDEARRLNHHYVGTEHLLLGLVREGEGIAAQALERLGVTPAKVSAQAIQVLRQAGAPHEVSRSRFVHIRFIQSLMEVGDERFDTFTLQLIRVLVRAEEEARRLHHDSIGTEHLLLALTREENGVATKVLSNLGVDLTKVPSTIEFIVGRGDRIVISEIPVAPRARRVIELAVDEAHRLNHHYIGTEHLLLGLVREREGIAAQALESLGVKLEKVRTQTIKVLNQQNHS